MDMSDTAQDKTGQQKKTAGLPNIDSSFSEWYNDVVYSSELADHSPVRGCIVIRPYGYALWEEIKCILDKRIKETGHKNASFPLLIPESFLKREAQHVEGFAPEVAVVTYAGGKKLAEPLIIRPTSETIIHYMFARWLKSWRDLPIKINQWANVIRWEMRTRPFLRTTEFFWQEGHTAHETHKEARDEALMMLDVYVDIARNWLAIPVIAGEKSESERFAGADITLTIEGLMQDGKALQMGTSHMISQSFAKSFDMVFQNREGTLSYPFLTSWGATTRLVGAVVMVHGDQKGLILPPRIAPIQVIIIPISFHAADKTSTEIAQTAQKIKEDLGTSIRVEIDDDDTTTPGAKFYKWELKGVPLRLEIGKRDLEKQQAILVNRLTSEKQAVSLSSIKQAVEEKLVEIQRDLLKRAEERRDRMWHRVAKLDEFAKDLESAGGFYQTGWCRREECEERLKAHKASIRCVVKEHKFTQCFGCALPSSSDILVARAY